MATISYDLRAAYAGGAGGVIFVDNFRSYDVGAGLTAGSGTITIDASDSALVNALDAYTALKRSGSSSGGTPPATVKQGQIVVSRPDPVTVALIAILGTDGNWTASSSLAPMGALSTSSTNVFTGDQSFQGLMTWRSPTGGAITAKPLGEGAAGLFDLTNDDTVGYLFHLHTGPNSGAGTFAFGIGTDKGAGGGGLISAKAAGPGFSLVSNPSHTGRGLGISGYGVTDFPFRVDGFVGSLGAAITAQSGQGFGDGVANGTTTFTSAGANFISGDVGATITQLTSRGEGFVIPAGTTIASVTNSTTVVLSQATTGGTAGNGSGTGINFLIANNTASRPIPAGQKLLTFFTDATTLGSVSPQAFQWKSTLQIFSTTGSNPNQATFNGSSMRTYVYNGSNYNRSDVIFTAAGGSLTSYAAANVGSESGAHTAISWGEVSGAAGLAFFGGTRVVKQSVAATATDLATAITLVNSLRTLVTNYSLA